MIHSSLIHGVWYALHVKVGRERSVGRILANKGYEEYVPLYGSEKNRYEGKVDGNPLFPGYVFLCFNSHLTGSIVTTPGVIRILGTASGPSCMDQQEIDTVRSIQSSGCHHEPYDFTSVGKLVRIEYGPLRGLKGIVSFLKNHSRLIVSVALLQRSVWVEVDHNWLVPDRSDIPCPRAYCEPGDRNPNCQVPRQNYHDHQ
jgi:transcription antitermination factor NusG